LREIRTVCPRDCYDTCGLIARVGDNGEVLSVRGDPQHPITRGLTCPRAAKDQVRLYRNRVEAPFIRRKGRFHAIGWEEALDTLAQRLSKALREHGPETLLYLAYAGNMGLLTELFPQRLWNALGATQTDYSLCSESGHRGIVLHYGHSYGLMPEDLPDRDFIVFWGFNAAVSAPHIWALARKARRRKGASIAVVDPFKTRTVEGADLWLRPRPGSDVALAYGIMHHLVREGRVDRAFIEEWTRGFEALEEEVLRWPPERTENCTGVPWKDVAALADAYGKAEAPATLIGIGLQKCVKGADQVRAVSLVPALLGFHRAFFYSNGEAFQVDKAGLKGARQAAGRHRVVSQVDLADRVKEGLFRCIFVSLMNPALTLPNQTAFRKGISREEVFLAVHETHWTRTAQLADLVLPAPTFMEKDDVVIPYGHPYARLAPKVVEPVTDSRSEVWLMRELASRLGLRDDWLFEDPWKAVETALTGALEGRDWHALLEGQTVALRRRPVEVYPTPSGKIEFYSTQAGKLGWDPLPRQRTLDIPAGRFQYVAGALPLYTHTQFQEVYGDIPPEVYIHPLDAERLGVLQGDRVALSNERSEVTMRAVVSEKVLPGVLWSPRQLEGLDGRPQNGLTSGSPQEIGGGPTYNSTLVTIVSANH